MNWPGSGGVVCLDVRGRGYSDKPTEGFTLPIYADDVAGLIEQLGLEKPVILGHSMGARIGAALGVLHPDVASSLIIVDPPLTGPGRETYNMSVESFKQQIRDACEGTTAEAVAAVFPGWPERELKLRVDWLPSCDEVAVADTHRLFDVEDFFAYWAQLEAPLQFIYGDESPAVTSSGVEEIRETNAAAEIVGIAGAGHMIPWQNLNDFVEAIEDFLGSLETDR